MPAQPVGLAAVLLKAAARLSVFLSLQGQRRLPKFSLPTPALSSLRLATSPGAGRPRSSEPGLEEGDDPGTEHFGPFVHHFEFSS